MTSMDSIVVIADLKRPEFLATMKKIIIMHLMQDRKWIDQEQIVKEYIEVLNQL